MKLEVPNQNYPEIRKTYQRLRYIAVNDCEWLSMTFTSSYHIGDRGLYQNQIPIERERERERVGQPGELFAELTTMSWVVISPRKKSKFSLKLWVLTIKICGA